MEWRADKGRNGPARNGTRKNKQTSLISNTKLNKQAVVQTPKSWTTFLNIYNKAMFYLNNPGCLQTKRCIRKGWGENRYSCWLGKKLKIHHRKVVQEPFSGSFCLKFTIGGCLLLFWRLNGFLLFLVLIIYLLRMLACQNPLSMLEFSIIPKKCKRKLFGTTFYGVFSVFSPQINTAKMYCSLFF